jgi:hypothetical protein
MTLLFFRETVRVREKEKEKKKKDVKPKEVKTGCNLTEFYKEGYGSQRAVLPMMMMTVISER